MFLLFFLALSLLLLSLLLILNPPLNSHHTCQLPKARPYYITSHQTTRPLRATSIPLRPLQTPLHSVPDIVYGLNRMEAGRFGRVIDAAEDEDGGPDGVVGTAVGVCAEDVAIGVVCSVYKSEMMEKRKKMMKKRWRKKWRKIRTRGERV